MKKWVILFFALTLLAACGEATNISQIQQSGNVNTNYVVLVSSVEQENVGNGKYYYIDGEVDENINLDNVKLFWKEKGKRSIDKIDGTYNFNKFSFTLPLSNGDYVLTIEATDLNGNKYIQKDLLLHVE